jgi:hypothetical protein
MSLYSHLHLVPNSRLCRALPTCPFICFHDMMLRQRDKFTLLMWRWKHICTAQVTLTLRTLEFVSRFLFPLNVHDNSAADQFSPWQVLNKSFDLSSWVTGWNKGFISLRNILFWVVCNLSCFHISVIKLCSGWICWHFREPHCFHLQNEVIKQQYGVHSCSYKLWGSG